MMNSKGYTLVAALIVVSAPVFLNSFMVSLTNYITLASIVVLGLVLLTGVAGITSFGQAAFVGLGAYITAVLTTRYGISPWITLCCTVILAAGAAWIIGKLTLKLWGH